MKLKIRNWNELAGKSSIDKWGFKTTISIVDITDRIRIYRETDDNCFNIEIPIGDNAIEELSMYGFEVEFITMPELTPNQVIELEYLKVVKGCNYIAKDEGGLVYAYEFKPLKNFKCWRLGKGNFFRLEFEYEFISCDDEEPWVIEDLLKANQYKMDKRKEQ